MSTVFDEKREHLIILGALVAQHLPPQEIPDDQWEELIGLSTTQHLGPMLYWVVKQSGLDVSSKAVWQPLRQLTLQTSARHMKLEHAAKQVDAELSAARIRTLWLKGIVLARTVYPRPSLRPMGDLDVLIPYEQRESALNTVQLLGYQLSQHTGDLDHRIVDLRVKVKHHYQLENSSGNGIILELHSRLPDSLLSIRSLNWFWSQTQAVETGTFTFSGLRPEAHLLYLSAHAILQHGEAYSNLRQYFDIHQLVSTYPLDWRLLGEQATLLGWAYAVERALTLAVRFFDTRVPPSVLAELKANQFAGENAVRSFHLQGNGKPWEKTRAHLAILSRKDRARFLYDLVFPPRAYLRQVYQIAPDRPVWPQYLYRWLNQGRIIGWWLWDRLAMSRKGRGDNK